MTAVLAARPPHAAGLTGPADRETFLGHVERALHQLGGIAVIALDIDRFRAANDAVGQHACDEILTALGRRLQEAAGPDAAVARLGGDAFAVLCTDVRSERDALAAGCRLLDAVATPFSAGDRTIVLSASVGVVHERRGEACPRSLLGDADAARSRAKRRGGGRMELYEPAMGRQAVDRARLEQDLRRAIDRDELVLAYQPVVSLADGRIAGVEALVRWRHPVRGLLPPTSFLPVAEDSGLIVDVGRTVLTQACGQLARWAADPSVEIPWLSVNVSGRQIADPVFPHELDRILTATGAPPARVRLEVTEAVLLAETTSPAGVLDRFRQLGVGVCLHDFGGASSSLAALRRVRVDGVKIDRSFIAGITTSEVDRRILRAVVDIGAALAVEVIAEGIETTDQAQAVAVTGCRLGQGYLYCRPCAADELAPRLRGAGAGAAPAAAPEPAVAPDEPCSEPAVGVSEAAAALSVSTSKLRRWADTGRIRTTRSGGHRRVPVGEIRRLRAEGAGGPAVAVRLAALPDGPLAGLGAVLRAGGPDLAARAGRLVYEPDRPGWLAGADAGDALRTWIAALAACADSGRWEHAVGATTALLKRGERAGVTAVEHLTLIERTSALAARALGEREDGATELPDVARLFARLRQLVAETADGGAAARSGGT
jgi:diguanylate cyclase (GGDEF)-like protein/excisionase family DNA binding protein